MDHNKLWKILQEMRLSAHLICLLRNLYAGQEAKEFKKRWQENTELYKKGLSDLDNQDGLVFHLELDILECEIKWVVGSITMNKTSRGDQG